MKKRSIKAAYNTAKKVKIDQSAQPPVMQKVSALLGRGDAWIYQNDPYNFVDAVRISYILSCTQMPNVGDGVFIDRSWKMEAKLAIYPLDLEGNRGALEAFGDCYEAFEKYMKKDGKHLIAYNIPDVVKSMFCHLSALLYNPQGMPTYYTNIKWTPKICELKRMQLLLTHHITGDFKSEKESDALYQDSYYKFSVSIPECCRGIASEDGVSLDDFFVVKLPNRVIQKYIESTNQKEQGNPQSFGRI